jgi:protocatechuate 4,5-dioxygenase alpha chain
MSASRLDRVLINRLFYEVQKSDGLAAYRADRGAWLDRYDFSPELRAAIERTDIAAMYRAGANPYLLRFYCVNQGVSEGDYLSSLHAMQGSEIGGPDG